MRMARRPDTAGQKTWGFVQASAKEGLMYAEGLPAILLAMAVLRGRMVRSP